MSSVQLVVEELRRGFGRRPVLSGVTVRAEGGQGLVVTGANGSGKSTFLSLLAGLIAPDSGCIRYLLDGVELAGDRRRSWLRRRASLVAPDLQLYGELSALENLEFFARVRGYVWDRSAAVQLLDRMGLKARRRDPVRCFSSGMRVRMRYAVALYPEPDLLLLDEPTAMLDETGSQFVDEVIAEQKQRGLLVVATNDPRELRHGDVFLRLEPGP